MSELTTYSVSKNFLHKDGEFEEGYVLVYLKSDVDDLQRVIDALEANLTQREEDIAGLHDVIADVDNQSPWIEANEERLYLKNGLYLCYFFIDQGMGHGHYEYIPLEWEGGSFDLEPLLFLNHTLVRYMPIPHNREIMNNEQIESMPILR